ncbi:TetR/AcrR family transcriptional regulator C-terminal domain-containing protein [Allokutzneria oryzae]|uniref:TetR/AcrR family transcriptional regulator C-terminal domain-containing protein n=1 Tax=Allokutzneria oryzae TaxID=1378989 RepID=A0ABV6A6H4_9PSEU
MANTERRNEIVAAALELLDEKGADAVSLRAVADRLDVRLNTVSWHVKTKARLLELMADAIVAAVTLEKLPRRWDARLRELSRRYRAALLGHRDGARIVAGTYAAEEHTLRMSEAFVATLLDGGLSEKDAAWTTWTISYFVLGITQEEQNAPTTEFPATLSPATHPALSRVFGHLVGGTFDERFDYGLSLIVNSLRPE